VSGRARRGHVRREDASGKTASVNRLFPEAVAEWLELKQAKMSTRGHSAYAHHCDSWTAFFPEKATVRDITIGYRQKHRGDTSFQP